jgi:small subunit ribosomal protein S20
MANIKSAKKRVKVIASKSFNNKSRKSELKTMLKKASAAASENSAEKKAAVLLAIKRVDQAAAHNLIHKNCAARKKAQLARLLNA